MWHLSTSLSYIVPAKWRGWPLSWRYTYCLFRCLVHERERFIRTDLYRKAITRKTLLHSDSAHLSSCLRGFLWDSLFTLCVFVPHGTPFTNKWWRYGIDSLNMVTIWRWWGWPMRRWWRWIDWICYWGEIRNILNLIWVNIRKTLQYDSVQHMVRKLGRFNIVSENIG